MDKNEPKQKVNNKNKQDVNMSSKSPWNQLGGSCYSGKMTYRSRIHTANNLYNSSPRNFEEEKEPFTYESCEIG